jgi:hypothetical protein
MTLNPGREPRADTRDIHQPKETHKKGAYLLGTDFRHAVEFSRSGRSRHPAVWAFDRGGCSTLRRSLCPSSGGSRTRARRWERRRPVQPAPSGWCSRSPLSCWAAAPGPTFGAVTRSPSRSGLAGRREKVTCVSSGLSNRCGVTPDTGPEPCRHAPFTWAEARCTPATERFPRRRTSHPPGSQSASPGTASASVTRSLFR